MVAASHSNAVYEIGQPIRWHVEWKDAAATDPLELEYVLKRGGLSAMRQGKLHLTNGVGDIEVPAKEAGTLLLEIKARGNDGKTIRALGGAVVAPEKIRPSAARPDDFDAFWNAKIEELSKVPSGPKLVPGDGGKPGVSYWQITMDNIRGSHIHGQLARPATGERFPAVLIVQWAGVYGLQKSWVSDRAASGWLALNINPHDLPIDQPPGFYDSQSKGPLKDYPAIGNDDRETSYFLRMYLSCYRAVEYLAGRPDWDGKTLVVTGTSQGGLQTLMIAGLNPKVTAAMANVPAGCDLTGPLADRSPGWPGWYYKTEGKDAAKVIEASRYYDVVNFAARIRCPVLVSVGMIDETCPPAGILAAMNQVRSPKEIVVLPYSDHQGVNDSQRAYYKRMEVWLGALKEGKPVPAVQTRQP